MGEFSDGEGGTGNSIGKRWERGGDERKVPAGNCLLRNCTNTLREPGNILLNYAILQFKDKERY